MVPRPPRSCEIQPVAPRGFAAELMKLPSSPLVYPGPFHGPGPKLELTAL